MRSDRGREILELAEEQLVRRYRGPIECMARTLLDGAPLHVDLEDMVQRASLELLEAARELRDSADATPVDQRLRMRIWTSLLDEAGATATSPRGAAESSRDLHDQASLVEVQVLWAIVQRAMRRLPAAERGVLQLHYLRDSTMRQVGSILGITQSRASQIHHNALTRLRTWVRRFEA